MAARNTEDVREKDTWVDRIRHLAVKHLKQIKYSFKQWSIEVAATIQLQDTHRNTSSDCPLNGPFLYKWIHVLGLAKCMCIMEWSGTGKPQNVSETSVLKHSNSILNYKQTLHISGSRGSIQPAIDSRPMQLVEIWRRVGVGYYIQQIQTAVKLPSTIHRQENLLTRTDHTHASNLIKTLSKRQH